MKSFRRQYHCRHNVLRIDSISSKTLNNEQNKVFISITLKASLVCVLCVQTVV